jgi:hypothetical protein
MDLMMATRRNGTVHFTLTLPQSARLCAKRRLYESVGKGREGHMLPRSADQVVERMRHACLDGVRLLSDRQPISFQDWSKLAYQFGHELGHVNGQQLAAARQACPTVPMA